jgi:hypothetical protein
MMTTPAPTLTSPPPSDEIRARIVRVLAEILERDVASGLTGQRAPRRPGHGLAAARWSSSRRISHEFRIDLAVEDAFGITTLDEVVSLVSAQLRAQR